VISTALFPWLSRPCHKSGDTFTPRILSLVATSLLQIYPAPVLRLYRGTLLDRITGHYPKAEARKSVAMFSRKCTWALTILRGIDWLAPILSKTFLGRVAGGGYRNARQEEPLPRQRRAPRKPNYGDPGGT
jgi:hypothetical protein